MELLNSVTSGMLKWWSNELLESSCDVRLVNTDNKFEEAMESISSDSEESVFFNKPNWT